LIQRRAQLAGDWGNYSAFVKPVLDQILPIEAALGPVPLAPRSGSLSGYREIYDVSWRTVIAACCRLSSMACLPPFW
jgi:hypothetical protein